MFPGDVDSEFHSQRPLHFEANFRFELSGGRAQDDINLRITDWESVDFRKILQGAGSIFRLDKEGLSRKGVRLHLSFHAD